MSTKVADSPTGQPMTVYSQSVYYNSKLPTILKSMKVKALSLVPDAANTTKWTKLGSSFTAKKIVNIVYSEFTQLVRSQFAHPQYNSFLECSITNLHSYFYQDLLGIIEKALQDSGVKEYPK
jgi:hypothetical protein